MEPGALLAVAIALAAVTVVHWTHKCRSAAAWASIVPILAVLTARAALPLIAGTILSLILPLIWSAKIAPASPRFAIARVLRLVQSFIHSYTCKLELAAGPLYVVTWYERIPQGSVQRSLG